MNQDPSNSLATEGKGVYLFVFLVGPSFLFGIPASSFSDWRYFFSPGFWFLEVLVSFKGSHGKSVSFWLGGISGVDKIIRKRMRVRTVWLYQSVCHILFGVNVDKLYCSSSSNHGSAVTPNPKVDMTI